MQPWENLLINPLPLIPVNHLYTSMIGAGAVMGRKKESELNNAHGIQNRIEKTCCLGRLKQKERDD